MKASRTLAVARREGAGQLQNPVFWGLLGFLLFATVALNPAAMVPSGDAAVGGVAPFANSAHAVAQVFALGGVLFYTFFLALLGGLAVIRDDEAQVGPLLHTTPLTPGEYIAGKFLGVLAAGGLAVAVHVALTITWQEGGALVGSTNLRGPFGLGQYLIPALVLLGPGLVFATGVAFAIGEHTRSPLAAYGTASGLFLLGLGGLIPRPPSALSPWLDTLFSAFDLWGARWLSTEVFGADRGVAFYNHAPLPLDGAFWLQRLFLLFVPLVLVGASVRHCRRVARGQTAGRPPKRLAPREQPNPPTVAFGTLGELAMTAAPPGFWRATREITRVEIRQGLRQPGLYLFTAFAMGLVVDHASNQRGVFDAPLWLTSGGLAVGLIEVVTGLGCLLVLFQLVEALDRPRRERAAALLFSAPAPTVAWLLGPALAAAAALGFLLAGCGAAALGLIWAEGQMPVELWPFVRLWGLALAPTFAVWAAFVAALYTLTRGRVLAYVLAFAGLLATAGWRLSGEMTWLSNWPLWGALRWSAFGASGASGGFGAFEPSAAPLLLNRLQFSALALAFGAVALRHLPRREGARAAPLRPAGWVAVTLLTGMVIGPAVALRAGIAGGFQGEAELRHERDYWARNVATWADAPGPEITHLDARIELTPAQRRFQVAGTMDLAGPAQGLPLGIPFSMERAFEGVRWTLDGAPVPWQDHAGLHLLRPEVPITPGQVFRVGFTYQATWPRGFTRNGGAVSEFVSSAGVVLHTLGPSFLPVPGFVAGRGVDAARATAPRQQPEGYWHAVLPPLDGGGRPFTARLEVTAPSEYTVNAVGVKTHEHHATGRTTVVWETDHPVRYLNLVAGRWVVARGEGVAVFHHPAHPHNVAEMLTTLAAARRWYSEWFAPYPWRELRISEYPDFATRAQGFPTHIPFSEGIGFLARSEGGPGLPTVVTAHEAAHQWWAHLLVPGQGPGADVLLEGLAHFSTMLLLEAEHGNAARIHFATSLEQRYGDTRRVDAERPLVEVTPGTATAETVIYDKGAWVLWMLQRELGRERLLTGLREFITRFSDHQDHPVLEDLLTTLRPHAPSPEAFDHFTQQWFQEVVVPELVLRGARREPAPGGWRVLTTVENVGTGAVTVELAAWRGERFTPGFLEARTVVQLEPGKPREVAWFTPFAPEGLTADPDAHLLQLHRERAWAAL